MTRSRQLVCSDKEVGVRCILSLLIKLLALRFGAVEFLAWWLGKGGPACCLLPRPTQAGSCIS